MSDDSLGLADGYVAGQVFEQLVDLARLDDNRFLAPAAPEGGTRTFGGQLLAQTLRAAQLAVSDDRVVHSLHSYFLRPGDVDKRTTMVVDTVRDGRSFSVREVRALQDDRELYRTLISFHVPEPGLEHPTLQAPDVAPPEEVTLTYSEFCEALEGRGNTLRGHRRPMDIRYINPPVGASGPPITEPQLMWMRISDSLPDDPALHAAGLAYLADSTLIDHVMLPHGLRWQDERLSGASLDHAMWFHRPVKADDWLFYDQRVDSTSGARGLASGRFFTAGGELVATCSQEGLMRFDLD